MMNWLFPAIGSLALVVLLTGTTRATTITFENAAAGDNSDIPLNYGSNIAADSTGFVTTDGSGATPNISLSWVGNRPDEWEYHTSTTWLHESPVHVAQIDLNRFNPPDDDVAEIVFAPIDGRSVKINSFLLSGATNQAATATFDWEVVGAGVSGTLNVDVGTNTGTVPVNFTGASGVSYTLRFTRTSSADTGFGTALDDLSFGEELLPSAEVLRLIVDRDTGGITLSNVGSNPANIKGYSITSSVGALNQSGWKPITGNYDVSGIGSVDIDDDWTKLTAAGSTTDFSEFEFGGDGGTIAASSSVVLNVPAGNAWVKYPTEDLEVEVVMADGRINRYSVEYINGPAGSFALGDLNFDGAINSLDWPIYNAGRGADLSGLSLPLAYQQGDLDGDLDNDIADFVLFKAFFVAGNGAGSFEALFDTVPEPTSVMLLITGLVSLIGLRPKLAAKHSKWRSPRRALVTSRCAVVLCSLVMLPILAGTARATTLTFALNASGVAPPNNSDINPTYGSNIAVETPAFITSDGTGATPNIALTWAPTGGPEVDNEPNANVLEFHSAATFQGFGFTVPVLQFDMDLSQHTTSGAPADPTIDFTATGDFALKVNSFDIGNATDQNGPAYRWNVNLIRLSDMMTVATQTTGFLVGGSFETVTFDYTGDPNESYRLHFDDEGANQVRTGIDNLSFSQVSVNEPKMTLFVSTNTGAVSLANDSGTSFDIDSYEILSASDSLDPIGWSSLQAQDFEGNGAPGTGNGWEEAGGSGTSKLIESYLLGDSTISNGASISLGNAFDFDKIGVQQDLQFLYHIAGTGAINRVGLVEYVLSAGLNGDYNGNDIIDAADYTTWRDAMTAGATSLTNDPTPGVVDESDFLYWRAHFGETLGSGSGAGAALSSAVPEPSTLGLIAVLLVGLATGYLRRVAGGWATNGHCVRLVAVISAVFLFAHSASAAVTVDRLYLFGEHPSEVASAGSVVGNGPGETLDSVSQAGSQFDDDAQNLTPNSLTLGPKYANVGPTFLNRPGALAGQFGAQFDGVDDRLVGIPLNRPDETGGPDFVGNGPLLFPFPFNYDKITARGLQMWVYPDAAAIGTHRQGIVFDTIAAGGVSITADGKWTQTNDSRVLDGVIPATVPVVGDQWYHVMQHIYPSSQPGAPSVVAGTGAGDLGFTSVVYVKGVAVSANNGSPTPGELDDGDRIGVLAVGAEEVATIDFVNPEFTNYFTGVVDDLKMYVFGDNSSLAGPPAGQDYGTFDLFSDNDWIADQIALLPGGILKPGDVNRDGNVDPGDTAAFVAGWLKEKRLKGSTNTLLIGDWETWGWGDLNLDGVVNFHDALILDQQLSLGSGSGLSFELLGNPNVPEPASSILAIMGMLALTIRRKLKRSPSRY